MAVTGQEPAAVRVRILGKWKTAGRFTTETRGNL